MFSRDQYDALHTTAGYLPRTDRGRLQLAGADRKSYLQGLLSNDILALTPGTGCYATLLTAQGRMIADMRVFDVGETLLLDLEHGVTDAVRAHLDMFVITEDVTVQDVTATIAQVGLYGPRSADILSEVRSRGLEPLHVLPGNDIGIEGLELFIPAGADSALQSALDAAGAIRVDEATAEVTRVEAGIPRFLVDMDTATIPLEAGIEDRAISLTKGCYVGQEVIIRVLHRGGGRVARKLVRVALDAPDAAASDSVFAGDREVGRVTTAVDSPKFGRRLALAFVHRDFVAAGAQLTVKGMPATVVA